MTHPTPSQVEHGALAEVTQLRLDVAELTGPTGLLAQLAALLPEPVADPTVGTFGRHKVTGSPAPWHVEAAGVLMDVHAGARRLEDDLRSHLDFTPVAGTGRGSSAANTARALRALPDLAAAAGDAHAHRVTAAVSRWARQAREVRDIDQSERWVPVPRLRGSPPPACPYCRTYALRMRARSGEVRCTNVACTDPHGAHPKARIVIGAVSGAGMLEFGDGTLLTFADREEAS